MEQEIKILREELLSDNWYILKKFTFERKRSDGIREQQAREVYDRGNGSTILLMNRDKQTVVLTRQFRLPTYLNGNAEGQLIEACAGLLDGDSPEEAILREAEEETGYRVLGVRKIGEAYMSPGSVTEILHFYVADYTEAMRCGEGGGVADEQEHIEVLELPFREALRMIDDGRIRDAKTIMLLRHAQLRRWLEPPRPLHVLIAGPYHSGTGDDTERIERNMALMNAVALQVYEMGHLPVLGEWYALPLLKEAGSEAIGDAVFQRMFHPSAIRLLEHCDAVLRIGGPSQGADEMVRVGLVKGKAVYYDLSELPSLRRE